MSNNRAIANQMMRFKWGNEINANYAGSTAQLRGDDLLSTISFGSITDPDPFPGNTARVSDSGSPDPNVSFPPGISADQVPGYTELGRSIATGQFFGDYLKTSGLLLLAIIIIGIGVYALVK